MKKVTFLASIKNRGTDSGLGIDFANLEILDDPRNDEFFQTETYPATTFDGIDFEKTRTKPHTAKIYLSNMPTVDKFLPAWDNSNYRITIEKVDEEPEKRYYKEEDEHKYVDEAGQIHRHSGPQAACTACGVQPKRDGSSSEDSSGDS